MCVCGCACIYVKPFDLRDYKIPDELSMDGMECERLELQYCSISSVLLNFYAIIYSPVFSLIFISSNIWKLRRKVGFACRLLCRINTVVAKYPLSI